MWRTKFCSAYYDIVKTCVTGDYKTYKVKSVMNVSSGKFTPHE